MSERNFGISSRGERAYASKIVWVCLPGRSGAVELLNLCCGILLAETRNRLILQIMAGRTLQCRVGRHIPVTDAETVEVRAQIDTGLCCDISVNIAKGLAGCLAGKRRSLKLQRVAGGVSKRGELAGQTVRRRVRSRAGRIFGLTRGGNTTISWSATTTHGEIPRVLNTTRVHLQSSRCIVKLVSIVKRHVLLVIEASKHWHLIFKATGRGIEATLCLRFSSVARALTNGIWTGEIWRCVVYLGQRLRRCCLIASAMSDR